MRTINRLKFSSASSVRATACAAYLSFLAPISRAVAGDTRINPDDVMFGPETDRLLQLLRSTSREQCVPAFVKEVKAGLSYRQFLTVLFLSAIDNGDLLITVADNGPGIPAESRAAALKRFGRLDPARGKPGSGLGLSLVEAVGRLHNGMVTLADNGPGLKILLTLRRP